ncbi:MAG: DoxX family protein [Minisyncoccia bacterium]|jgi:uncharacterized membrane protein YphA (DoxX/SURF4 family)
MIYAFLAGRVILGLYWLHAAYGHIFKASGMVGYAQSKGVKSAAGAKFAVIGTGILALVGGLSILAGYGPELGIACLAIFLVGVSFKMHPYWKEADPMAKMGDRINFWKNMALLGALLAMLAIPLPWAYSLGW